MVKPTSAMVRVLSTWLCACSVAFVTGCDDSAANDDENSGGELEGSCNVRAELTGAVTASLSGDKDLACALPTAFDSDFTTVFALPGGDVGTFELRVEGVAEKQTGTFTALVSIAVKDDGPRFANGTCSVTISENSFVADRKSGGYVTREYQVRGSGTCSEPLVTADGAGGSVEIGPFEFVTAVMWQ